MKTTATIATLALVLLATAHAEDEGQCCMAGQSCCKNFGKVSCQSTTSCSAVGAGTKYTGGGSCGPGQGDWCGLGPNPNKPKPSSGGDGNRGTVTCNGVTCDQGAICCSSEKNSVTGKDEVKCSFDKEVCDKLLEETLQKLITYATIGGIILVVCSVAGGIFCCMKKKLTVSNRGRGESVIEVKNGAFQVLDDSNYQAPKM